MGEHTAFLLVLAATLTLSSEVSATDAGLGTLGESRRADPKPPHPGSARRLCGLSPCLAVH